MWVTRGSYVGHIQIALWVSGSSGSTGVTHFQPCNVLDPYFFLLLCLLIKTFHAFYSDTFKYIFFSVQFTMKSETAIQITHNLNSTCV